MGCDNKSEGSFGSAFASPAVSRSGLEKAGLGRTRPRFVKVRKQSNSHNGKSGPGSNPIDSGFNPFQSGSESSDRVKCSVSTSNGFSDSTSYNKFGNVDFGFSRDESDWMSNSCLHSGEFGGNVGKLGCEIEKLEFVFGANRCDSGRVLGSERRGLGERVGKLGPNDTGKLKMESGENVGEFEDAGFVFGAKMSNLGSNLNLGQGESVENFKKPDNKARTNSEQQSGLRKFGDVEFVFGADHSGLASNSNLEKCENVGNLNFDDFNNMKMPTEVDRCKCDHIDFVFGAKRCNSAKCSNSKREESSENVGKTVPDDSGRTKIESDSVEYRKFDNLGFMHCNSASDTNLENKECTGNAGKVLSDEGGNMKSHIEADFMEVKATSAGLNSIANGNLNLDGDFKNGIFLFGNSSKKNVIFDQNTVSNSNYNFVSGNSSNTASSETNPVFKLPDELKKLNIDDFKNVESADKASASNVNSCADAEKIFFFGTSNKSFDFPTEQSETLCHDEIRNSKLDRHVTAGKSNVVNLSSNMGSGLRTSNMQTDLGSSSQVFGNETQSVNLSDTGFVDPAAGASCSLPFKSSEVDHIPQGHVKSYTNQNGAAAPSPFSSIGPDFHSYGSVLKESSDNKFNFTVPPNGETFANFKTPKWNASCSFTADIFPGLNKNLEFSAKSRSVKEKRSRKTRGRHPNVAKLCPQKDFVQRENSSLEIPDSPGLYSPMDFSPCQETVAADPCSGESSMISNDSSQQENNFVSSAAHSTFPADAKADLAASREGLDVKEGHEIRGERNGKSSTEMGIDELKSGAETECSSSSVVDASVKDGAGSNMKTQEGNIRGQYGFSSGFEDKFIFSALPSAQGSKSGKRQPRKKNKMKVCHDSFVITPSPDANFGSSPIQFSPLSSTSAGIGMAQDKKANTSISQNKGENNSEEWRKEESSSVSAALQEACEKWRNRGNKAYKNGDLSKAEDFYTQGVDSVPPSEISGGCLKPLVLCYSNRAATRMSLGKIREAIGDCAKASILDPNFLKVQMRAANCHLLLGEVEEALQYFNKCLESGRIVCLDRRLMIEASDSLQKAQKVAEHVKQSAELLQQKTTDAAVNALEKIAEGLSISLYSEKLLEMKAEALLVLRKYEEAIQLCEQTLGFAEKNFASGGNGKQAQNEDGFKCKRNSFVRLWRWRLISKSYFHMGRLELALDLLDKQEYVNETLESSIPLAVMIRELLQLKKAGNEAFQSGRYTEAIEHYTAALSSSVESRPFAAICLCNRAAAHQALCQIADAIADCSLAIALDGSYSKAVSRRATLHEKIRDYGQAAKDLQRLISVLEMRSDKSKQSGTPGRSSGNAKEIKQAHRRLSSMEEAAKKGIQLDLYLILGIKPSETAADIKKAYRKAALRHHPDKAGQFLARSESGDDGRLWKDIAEEVHKDADRLFKMIGEAYAVLSDPTKRSEYDFEEELRNSQSVNNSSRRTSDMHNSSFERNAKERHWQETWRTYGNSYSRW